jgi:hypothetical protein
VQLVGRRGLDACVQVSDQSTNVSAKTTADSRAGTSEAAVVGLAFPMSAGSGWSGLKDASTRPSVTIKR